MASMVEKNPSDDNELNGPDKVIIKKENIGLEEYQHQKFQYNLFNNIIKHDHYYEELLKIKDRLEKTVPNMQNVIHADMKRANINKIYERKLNHDLTGPRGLYWQRKQELQRLQSNERDVERELMRLKRELGRASYSSTLTQNSAKNENGDTSKSQMGQLPVVGGVNPHKQSPRKRKIVLRRSISVGVTGPTGGQALPFQQKRFSLNQPSTVTDRSWLEKPANGKSKEDRSCLQQHALIMDQQKRLIEQKLKHFLH